MSLHTCWTAAAQQLGDGLIASVVQASGSESNSKDPAGDQKEQTKRNRCEELSCSSMLLLIPADQDQMPSLPCPEAICTAPQHNSILLQSLGLTALQAVHELPRVGVHR